MSSWIKFTIVKRLAWFWLFYIFKLSRIEFSDSNQAALEHSTKAQKINKPNSSWLEINSKPNSNRASLLKSGSFTPVHPSTQLSILFFFYIPTTINRKAHSKRLLWNFTQMKNLNKNIRYKPHQNCGLESQFN